MKVVIIDTGCANMFSVITAMRRLGYQPSISSDAEVIYQADKLFMPGVGTAQAAMDQLRNIKLLSFLQTCTKPVLGICLGMQLLGSHSDESGGIQTLGIIEAPVKRMRDCGLPLPHIGWNKVTTRAGNRLFRGIQDDSYFYFVHSYAMLPCSASIAQANYGDDFSAAVEHDNFFGVQFHPERSGAAGRQLLKNFMEM